MRTEARYHEYASGWRRRRAAEQTALAERRRAARTAAQAISDLLHNQFGATRVFAVGSVTDRERFHAHSDLDLVVEGIQPDDYFKALAAAWKLLPPDMKLDLIPLEDATPEMREVVRSKGELLHG